MLHMNVAVVINAEYLFCIEVLPLIHIIFVCVFWGRYVQCRMNKGNISYDRHHVKISNSTSTHVSKSPHTGIPVSGLHISYT